MPSGPAGNHPAVGFRGLPPAGALRGILSRSGFTKVNTKVHSPISWILTSQNYTESSVRWLTI